jgi:hypothetical protein
MNLSDREIELIDGMIGVQLYHAEQCQAMIDRPGGNVVMAKQQLGWDMERVELLRKIKRASFAPCPDDFEDGRTQ